MRAGWQLQKAVFERLSTDTTLSGIITDEYDYVPEDAIFPYVVIGEANARSIAAYGAGLEEYRLEIHVFSRVEGKKETYSIMERVCGLLNDSGLTLSDEKVLANLKHSSSLSFLEEDGMTQHGVIRFRAVVQ